MAGMDGDNRRQRFASHPIPLLPIYYTILFSSNSDIIFLTAGPGVKPYPEIRQVNVRSKLLYHTATVWNADANNIRILLLQQCHSRFHCALQKGTLLSTMFELSQTRLACWRGIERALERVAKRARVQ